MPAHVCGMLRHECGGTTAALWRSQSTTAPIAPTGTRAGRHKTLGSREGDRTFPFWLGVITTALHMLLAHLPLCRYPPWQTRPSANGSTCGRPPRLSPNGGVLVGRYANRSVTLRLRSAIWIVQAYNAAQAGIRRVVFPERVNDPFSFAGCRSSCSMECDECD